MSDTPRTDAVARKRTITGVNNAFEVEEVYAEFARELERELYLALLGFRRNPDYQAGSEPGLNQS